MNEQLPPILSFKPKLFERIWGGHKLSDVCGVAHEGDIPVGEAWLVSDHPQHVSVIDGGPCDGQTLRDLLSDHTNQLLGHRAKLTIHGRFPLLFKLLDAADYLSVQVHPDDHDAKRLNEPDVGKTEMWHVLEAAQDSELICGMLQGTDPASLADAIHEGTVEEHLSSFAAKSGTTVFVPAGTVHAIGKNILLAEIQQNSDITYRVYDWKRLQPDGQPRELHIEKALEVIHFGEQRTTASTPLDIKHPSCKQTILGACKYFAAERFKLEGDYNRATRGDSFHLLLGIAGDLEVHSGDAVRELSTGTALMIPGERESYSVHGAGEYLAYYVPDLQRDIIDPLTRSGHTSSSIAALGSISDTPESPEN